MLFWTSLGTCVLLIFGHVARNGIVGSYSVHTPSFSRFFYTVFHSGCTSLFYLYHQRMTISVFYIFAKPNIVSLFPFNYFCVTCVCVTKYLVSSWLPWSAWLHLLLISLLVNLSYWFMKVCIHSGFQPFVGYMDCRYSLFAFFPLNDVFWQTEVLHFKIDLPGFSFAVGTSYVLFKKSFSSAG